MTVVQEFRPGLWLTELVLDDFAVRGAVIVGEERVLVWDTLSHPRDMEPIMEIVGEKPVYVVYSHADWDHCWGTVGIPTDIVIGHPACAARFASGEVRQKLEKMQAAAPDTWAGVQLIPPTLVMERGTIDLGGVTVEISALAGHTPDCMVAFVPEWSVLLAGDTVETPFPVLKEGGEGLAQWIDQLAMWAANEAVHTVIPAHGAIGDTSVIHQTLRYLRDLHEGQTPVVPDPLDDFYTSTHANNIKLMSP